jgi:hypothetical protein
MAKSDRMSEATPVIQPVACNSFVVRGLALSLASIDSVLDQLFLERDFNPTFMMLSSKGNASGKSDYAEFVDFIARNSNICYTPYASEVRGLGSKYLNNTTGQLLSIHAEYHLPVGSIVFGRFAIDEV